MAANHPAGKPPTTNVVAIVQARTGSTRLPDKVLAPVAGRPLLLRVLDRAVACRTVDTVMVATTLQSRDDRVVAMAQSWGATTYRGSTDDVLDRYHHAAAAARADVVVRVTADDPFRDVDLTDRAVLMMLADDQLDYVTTSQPPTWPEGVDVEVVRVGALATAWREATLPSDREHVTPFVWRQPDRFTTANLPSPTDRSQLRWTVDHPDDLAFADAVYRAMAPDTLFSTDRMLALLEARPDLADMNRGHERNEGYLASVRDENSEQGERSL